MEQLIDFHAPEVQAVLDTLLKDHSTGKNIIWATDPPEELQTVMYEPVTDRSQITTQQLGLTHYEVVLPRMMKQTDTQQQRTRKKGEVFSPAWVCNKMNNALDADWFRGLGAEESAGQFTVELPQGWQTVETPVQFPVCGGRTPAWVQYVQSYRLEVTCGEAPFLASRYDAATGEMIPVARRIGILDRKLRVVSENAATEEEWRKYATHAVQSTYGYEYQGDNLLLARVNLLLTYAEHLQARWQRKPTKEELQPIATIISWITLRTARQVVPMIYAYTTPEIARHNGWIKIGYTEQSVDKRLKQQTHTADVLYHEEWRGNAVYDDGSGEVFTDHDFHAYLRKLNVENDRKNEWFHLDGQQSRRYFQDFRMNRGRVQLDAAIAYTLREEQARAVRDTKTYYQSHPGGEYLWNAKPRFGKTLSVYDFCKQVDAQTVLIVTNRPAIANSWYSDYVSAAAYDKAVEVVTDVVRTETRKEDMRMIEDTKKWVLSPERKAPQATREYAAHRLDTVLDKFLKTMQTTAARLQEKLLKPEVRQKGKEQVKEKARDSVLQLLNRLQAEQMQRKPGDIPAAEKSENRFQ